MEQHPVPQNVTTFQFRLIGDMTIKQFGYLAAGAIVAYVCYRLPLPFFFTWPLTIAAVVAGFGLAFVPIEERPMDVWVVSFIKSIYSPTQFLWHKTAPPPPPLSDAPGAVKPPSAEAVKAAPAPSPLGASLQRFFTPQTETKKALPATKPVVTPATPTKKTPAPRQQREIGIISTSYQRPVFAWLKDWFRPKLTPTPPSELPPVFADISTRAVTGKRLDIGQPQPPPVAPALAPLPLAAEEARVASLEQKLKQLESALSGKTASDARLLELQQQLHALLSEKGKLEQELVVLRQKLKATPASPVPLRQATVAPPPAPATTVKIISREGAVKAGLPKLTTFPNIVTGIIKDHENNLLPGVLVTVRDQEGVPLRALKTNKLGQFAASTPLPNGTYLVEIEDPRSRYVFDRAQITLNGEVLPAIEILAKSQKELTRAKLAQEVFGEPKI